MTKSTDKPAGAKPVRKRPIHWDRWAAARRAAAKALSKRRDLPGQMLFPFMATGPTPPSR